MNLKCDLLSELTVQKAGRKFKVTVSVSYHQANAFIMTFSIILWQMSPLIMWDYAFY